jgi:hypothetical protein
LHNFAHKSVELARSPKHKSWLLPKSHQPYTKIAKPHKPKPSRLLPKSQPYTKIAKPSKTQTTPRLQNPKKVAKLDNIHPEGKLMLQNTTKKFQKPETNQHPQKLQELRQIKHTHKLQQKLRQKSTHIKIAKRTQTKVNTHKNCN